LYIRTIKYDIKTSLSIAKGAIRLIRISDIWNTFFILWPIFNFSTFPSLSYTIDIFRGRLEPTRNVLHFFSYLAMFPQLVAGPIVRAEDMLMQFAAKRKSSYLQK